MTLTSMLLLLKIMFSAATVQHNHDLNDDYNNNNAEKESTMNPVMQFTYGDNDDFGPLHWRNKMLVNQVTRLKSLDRSLGEHTNSDPSTAMHSKLRKLYANNFCQTNWFSPINIETKLVRVPELRRLKDALMKELLEETSRLPETLIIEIITSNIQFQKFEFGHPVQYHGIEIRPTGHGQIQLMDNFDPLRKTSSFTSYDFDFLTLFYCDLQKAKPYRTMHQINGKRYPLELEFVFLRKATQQEQENPPIKTSLTDEYDDDDDEDEVPEPRSKSTLYEGEYDAVIVAVLGEIGPHNNAYFKPIIEAATKFHGKNFKSDYTDYERYETDIKSPWSPTWLLPDSSDYYYYDQGSFPVPPCWSVARYYIMRETIKISQSQLYVLTHIETEREKNSKNILACTHSIAISNPKEGTEFPLVNGETPVSLNLIEYEMTGQDDGKPRTKDEKRKMMERKNKREIFRKRLSGEVANSNRGRLLKVDDTDNGSNLTLRKIFLVATMFFVHSPHIYFLP